MPELARAVGLGLAARGSVSDVVDWAQQARGRGVGAVWLHDSYFERDAVSYAAAVAAAVDDISVALGAVNPYTRHPVVLAMTVSALDEMAPGRVVLGLGTGLPLRLAQMGIAYDRDDAVVRVEKAIHDVRALWRGERLPSPSAGVPELAPMFPPVHRVPIYLAGYRRAWHEMAGRLADGYLARPAESVPALRAGVTRIRDAAETAGRDPAEIDVAGYLLSLADASRRAALNRAKREPFVIYMLGVQSDAALARVGIEPALRDAVFAAWRQEAYHQAAELIPDELVDAFLLCGTPQDIAARVEHYRAAGMTQPVLQPVVQEEDQVAAVLDAAVLAGGVAPVPAPARESVSVAAAGAGPEHDDGPVPLPRVPWQRRLGGYLEIVRPFSLTASTVPVGAAAAVAAGDGRLSWPAFLVALLASVLLHVGTNVVNEVYDVRGGLDTITSPRMSRALLTGRITERAALGFAFTAFGLAAVLGLGLVAVRGWPLLLIGVIGLVGGWGYTAPPLQYKYRALGLPLVFVLMGPLMVLGGYFAVTGRWSGTAAVVSLPIGLLVTAILHGNEWRDIGDDGRAGARTLSVVAGRVVAHQVYVALTVGAFMVLGLAVAAGSLPRAGLLAVLSLPLLVRALRASELGAAGQQRALALIDLQTAQLHALFGGLLVAGLALAAVSA
jgi:1,4-dihydroxy-2-naphthoate octaprenyltransferase